MVIVVPPRTGLVKVLLVKVSAPVRVTLPEALATQASPDAVVESTARTYPLVEAVVTVEGVPAALAEIKAPLAVRTSLLIKAFVSAAITPQAVPL